MEGVLAVVIIATLMCCAGGRLYVCGDKAVGLVLFNATALCIFVYLYSVL